MRLNQEKGTFGLNLAAIGLQGIWNGLKAKSCELIDDLAAINWVGRTVYIVYDYEPVSKTRHDVATARSRLAKSLLAAGAKAVLYPDIPSNPSEEAKVGIDDFLVANGPEAFQALVLSAQPAIPILSETAESLIKPEGKKRCRERKATCG